MVHRLAKLSKSQSFFLFGARGTGKSTLIRATPFLVGAAYFDLLDLDLEQELVLHKSSFAEKLSTLKKGSWVIIDEVQKIPSLLDVVHSFMESHKLKFALTGSSSRKLKRGGANLLAGRAVLFSLFPFTATELRDRFDLNQALRWGTLPKIFELESDVDKSRFLKSYVQTYLKEEIVAEQLVRNLDPFRMFLPIAAQMNGQVINYSNISRDTGVDYKTIQNYFQILEETYVGFFLESHSRSVRKAQRQSPKFYFFDTGVVSAISGKLTRPLQAQTSDYGSAFESWFINECVRHNSYYELDFKFSYLRTKDDVEVDLIIERPDGSISLVKIKSSEKIDDRHLRHLERFALDFPTAQLICVSQEKHAKKIGSVTVLPWQSAWQELGLVPAD
jgi:predicted AAA+ superfamily ATPase